MGRPLDRFMLTFATRFRLPPLCLLTVRLRCRERLCVLLVKGMYTVHYPFGREKKTDPAIPSPTGDCVYR